MGTYFNGMWVWVVSFVPIMKKQTYWILARFIKALILTRETALDLSVEEIFLYSSKMHLFPGVPTLSFHAKPLILYWVLANQSYQYCQYYIQH